MLMQGCPEGVLENPFELPSWALFSGCTAGILCGQRALASVCVDGEAAPCAV